MTYPIVTAICVECGHAMSAVSLVALQAAMVAHAEWKQVRA